MPATSTDKLCSKKCMCSPYPYPHTAYACALLEYDCEMALGAELARGGQACSPRTHNGDARGPTARGLQSFISQLNLSRV